MNLEIICIFISLFGYAFTYRYEKPLEKTLWPEHCKRNSVALNDCNWCWCDQNHQYQCKARLCEEVDMLGHFKDAIRDIDVGMEGKGSWRTKPSPCAPGTYYRRGDVACVCDDDGNWPSPVCRDLLRVMYSVELPGLNKITDKKTCSPSKLYLVGCNVCLCPSTGYLDPKLCTNHECQEDDPAVEATQYNKTLIEETGITYDNAQEIYAFCTPNHNYTIGCRKCTCLRNNRLLCDDCQSPKQPVVNSYCNKKGVNKIFKLDCNLCHCDDDQNMYCTVRKCLNSKDFESHKNQAQYKNPKLGMYSICTPGIRYKKNCNDCKCIKDNGNIISNCSAKICNKHDIIARQTEDCVEDTSYEVDCMICNCKMAFGEKRQICWSNPACMSIASINEKRYLDTEKLHGYCEPLHIYKHNCNNCTCLSDGKTLKCTSEICSFHPRHKVSIDVIPVRIRNEEYCPVGHSFELDCNICFCLSNGNAICTTSKCSKKLYEYD